MREFVGRLEAKRVQVRPNIAASGRVSGISYRLDHVAVKGSQLGRGYRCSYAAPLRADSARMAMGDHMSSRADTLAEMIRDTPSEDLASLIGDLDGAKAKTWALLVSAAIWEKEPRIPNPDRLLKMPEVAHVLGITEHQAREMGRPVSCL